jgi:hypothetical protein
MADHKAWSTSVKMEINVVTLPSSEMGLFVSPVY